MRIVSLTFSLSSGPWQTIVFFPIKFHQMSNFPLHLNHWSIISKACYLMSKLKLSPVSAFLPWVPVNLSMWKQLLWENSSVPQPNPTALGGSPHRHPGPFSLPLRVLFFCRVLKTSVSLNSWLHQTTCCLCLYFYSLLCEYVLKTWYFCHFGVGASVPQNLKLLFKI